MDDSTLPAGARARDEYGEWMRAFIAIVCLGAFAVLFWARLHG